MHIKAELFRGALRNPVFFHMMVQSFLIRNETLPTLLEHSSKT